MNENASNFSLYGNRISILYYMNTRTIVSITSEKCYDERVSMWMKESECSES